MKSMDVVKAIELSNKCDSIENIECVSKIDYEATSNGIKAFGKIEVSISAIKEEQIINDTENIDLDIFAPFEKLIEDTSLSVNLNSHVYEFDKELNVLNIVFKFDIDGLIEEDEQTDVFEDLLDDSNSMMITKKYILSGYNDTYESIANKYDISEAYLRQINDDKKLEHKVLVIISNT